MKVKEQPFCRVHTRDGIKEFDLGYSIMHEHEIKAKAHRIDGPAIEFATDCKEYYIDGIRHRMDGPAVINNPMRGTRFYIGGFDIDSGMYEALVILITNYPTCLRLTEPNLWLRTTFKLIEIAQRELEELNRRVVYKI
jgi:hypothetical protein